MLLKQNWFTVEPCKQFICKHLPDSDSLLAEEAGLRCFGTWNVDSRFRRIRVPNIGDSRTTDCSVSMQFVQGFRSHDIIALLNRIISKKSGSQIASAAYSVREELIEYALADLRNFQSGEAQESLHNQLQQKKKYDFRAKMTEAVEYVQKHYEFEANSAIQDEIVMLSDFLNSKASVCFRDASLKNQFIDFQGIAHSNCIDLTIDHRPSDHQLNHDAVAYAFLHHVLDSGDLQERIINIDFESVADLTLAEDDFIHILGFEVVGMSALQMIEALKKEIDTSEERFEYICFFRYFREWARRLFYKSERRATYVRRYRHETLRFNLNRASQSLIRIRSEGGNEFRQLFALLERATSDI